MNKEEIFNKLQEIIEDKIGIEKEEIELTSNFRNDLGFDSLDSVEVIIEIEIKFDLSIPDEEIQDMELISQAVDFIFNKIN